ncbi:MAG: universal stress protein [Chloroflexia bacterium]
MFGRILIGVADDEIADQVIHTAVSLAGALNAKLALVHVVDLAVAGAAAAAPLEAGAGPIATQEIVEEQERSGRSSSTGSRRSSPAARWRPCCARGHPPATSSPPRRSGRRI